MTSAALNALYNNKCIRRYDTSDFPPDLLAALTFSCGFLGHKASPQAHFPGK